MANNQSDSDSESSSDYETDKETRDTCRRQEPCLGTHKKKMKYNQKFSDLWLLNPMFKPCIKKKLVKGKYVPYCDPCNVSLSCAKTAIVRHGQSNTHKDNQKMHN